MKQGKLGILKWTLLSLLIYLTFLVVKLPASQVISRLQLPAGMSISGITGTIWNGQAQQLIAHGLPLNKFTWQLNALPLLWGSVSADVKAGNIRSVDEISFNGKVQVTQNSISAQDLQAYLPTNRVIALLPLPFPVQGKGRFKIQVQELEYTEDCKLLTGKGQWLKAQVRGLNREIMLGNFDAQLSCEKGDVLLEVSEPNSFGLSAIARVPKNMQFSVEGKFKPDANLPQEVHQAAQFFGQPDGQGYYPLRL